MAVFNLAIKLFIMLMPIVAMKIIIILKSNQSTD